MANGVNPSIILPLLIGIVPSIIWLTFWLRLARNKPEPLGLILICFFLGAASVLLATFLQQGAKDLVTDQTTRIAVYAGIEEVLKFGVFYLVAFRSSYDKEAIDPAMYLVAVALGFAALENIFYVLKPGLSFNITATLLTGTFRFFGSTLLHTIASAFIGIVIVLTPKFFRGVGIVLGIAGAIFLHTTFNFFILKNDTASFLQIYGYLWVTAIISHIILEKLRRLPPPETLASL